MDRDSRISTCSCMLRCLKLHDNCESKDGKDSCVYCGTAKATFYFLFFAAQADELLPKVCSVCTEKLRNSRETNLRLRRFEWLKRSLVEACLLPLSSSEWWQWTILSKNGEKENVNGDMHGEEVITAKSHLSSIFLAIFDKWLDWLWQILLAFCGTYPTSCALVNAHSISPSFFTFCLFMTITKIWRHPLKIYQSSCNSGLRLEWTASPVFSSAQHCNAMSCVWVMVSLLIVREQTYHLEYWTGRSQPAVQVANPSVASSMGHQISVIDVHKTFMGMLLISSI